MKLHGFLIIFSIHFFTLLTIISSDGAREFYSAMSRHKDGYKILMKRFENSYDTLCHYLKSRTIFDGLEKRPVYKSSRERVGNYIKVKAIRCVPIDEEGNLNYDERYYVVPQIGVLFRLCLVELRQPPEYPLMGFYEPKTGTGRDDEIDESITHQLKYHVQYIFQVETGFVVKTLLLTPEEEEKRASCVIQ